MKTRFLDKLKEWAKDLKRELLILHLAWEHPKTPWYSKLLAIIVVAYALNPIDLIPDFIPVLGHLDDLILLPIGIYLAIKTIPADVLAECREKAAERPQFDSKAKWFFAAIILLIWISVAVCLTTGCSTLHPSRDAALLLNDSSTLNPPANVTQSQANTDIETLIYALQSGYGGRKYIPATELSTALDKLQQLASSSPASQSTWNFCTEVAAVLFKLPDNHLSARLNGSDCNREHADLFSTGQVGRNLHSDPERPWAVNFRKARDIKVPVISITSFPYHEDAVWNGFLEEIAELRNSAPAIIIDMRGNGGGDDTVGRKVASILYGQEPPRSYQAIIKSQTPATMALAANNHQLKILRLRNKGHPVPDHLYTRLAEKMKLYAAARNGSIPPEDTYFERASLPYDERKAYNRPILILIDRGCQSSCESTLEAFEAHPHVVTIGENTGGFIHFGNMGQLVLPNSKIVVQLATDFWKYNDGRFLEKIGYAPKIRVPNGTDALDVALKEISAKRK